MSRILPGHQLGNRDQFWSVHLAQTLPVEIFNEGIAGWFVRDGANRGLCLFMEAGNADAVREAYFTKYGHESVRPRAHDVSSRIQRMGPRALSQRRSSGLQVVDCRNREKSSLVCFRRRTDVISMKCNGEIVGWSLEPSSHWARRIIQQAEEALRTVRPN